MSDTNALSSLRSLLDPKAVAAWLDEVESHRIRWEAARAPVPPETRVRVEALMTV